FYFIQGGSIYGRFWYSLNGRFWINLSGRLHFKVALAKAMLVDEGVQYLMENLASRGLKGNTTILFYTDHNAYSEQLAYRVKGYGSAQSPSMRVPAFIVSPNLKNITIEKFTCAFDLVPTLLQLFGIKYNPELYIGEDAFQHKTNVIISKTGSVFNHLFYTFDGTDLLWRDGSATEEDFRKFQSDFISMKEKWIYIDALYFNNVELSDFIQ
ncbi:MAG: LTA synthase family protein, partial [Acidobacteriota bacterium]|nr:LTA synthase family protein [Acidobacteriota bacterium]